MKGSRDSNETDSVNSLTSKNTTSTQYFPSEQRIKDICQNVSRLYTVSPYEKKVIVSRYYSSLCEFLDPLVKVKGRENLFAQFFTLTLFRKVEIEITNVEPILLHADLNNSASKNEYEINIFSKQSYFPISRWPIVLNAKTTLHLVYENNSWVVVKHKDVWLDYTRIDLAPELIKAAWGSLTSVVINTWYGLKT